MPEIRQQLRGLALSGGGFRATIFHLGVIRYLRETDRLRQLSHISSVSGGSVAAAHLVLNWNRYSGDDDAEFKRAAQEIVDFVQSDARGRLIGAWVLSWAIVSWLVIFPMLVAWYWQFSWWTWGGIAVWLCLIRFVCQKKGWPKSRSERLASAYKRHLFKNQTLPDLKLAQGPKLLIATTDLTSGDLWYFSDDGITHVAEKKKFESSKPTVAVAVAASSAFPPAFPPIEISSDILDVDAKLMEISHYLTDGGVYDNLGGRLLEYAGLPQAEIIVSSAEPRPDVATGSRFGLLIKRAERSTNILMQRVSELESECRSDAVQIRLQDDNKASRIPISVQHDVRTIRTDLNRFSPLEIQLLYAKGYESAKLALKDDAGESFVYEGGIPVSPHDGRWLPIGARNPGLAEGAANLDRSGRTVVGRLICLAIGILVAPFLIAVGLYFVSWWVPPLWIESTAKRWNATTTERDAISKTPWLHAFLTEGRTSFQADDGQDQVVAEVESEPIENSFLTLRPNSFVCYVGNTHATGEILYAQAFLKNRHGDLYKIVPVELVGNEQKIHVDTVNRGDRLFVLLSLSWPKDAEPDLVAKSIKLYLHSGNLK